MPRKAKVPPDHKNVIAKDLTNIAQTLRNRRKQLNWSQQELSDLVDCEITTIQAYEQKRRTPSLRVSFGLRGRLRFRY